MSEGRTPTATLTQQRQLEQEDIDILNQIVIRAQNDPVSSERPKDALLQAYGEVFEERRLSQHQDRACFDVLLRLLNPATPGESLYHKWENILQDEGIALAYDDDATTQDASPRYPTRALDYGHTEERRAASRALSNASQQIKRRRDSYLTAASTNAEVIDEIDESDYLDNPPTYIAHLLLRAEQRDRAVLFRQTLDALMSASELARDLRLEERADALYEMRLKQKTLKQCLAVFEDVQNSQAQADRIYCTNLARNALGKTRDEYRVHRVESIDDDRTKGLSLYKWVLATRETSFARRRERQTKTMVMRKLTETYKATQARQAQLEAILERRRQETRGVTLRSAMVFLLQKTNVTQEETAKAEMVDRVALHKASINAWSAKTGKLTELNLTAEDAREYFLMKRVFKQLRFIVRYRKERRAWLATWTTRKWQEFVKVRKHNRYDELYRQMRKVVKMNLGRRMLLRWQQIGHEHREQNARADACYHNFLTQRTVRPVIERMWDTADWVQNNEMVAVAKSDQFLEQRALVAIQMKQQSLLDMADSADRLRQNGIEQRAAQGLRQMQLKAFELQRRQSDAEAFRDRHDKRNVRNALARLRRILAERQAGEEGPLALLPAPAVTPARKREELLLRSSTRLSTTPAYTPFAARLRQEPRILENIEDIEEDFEETQIDMADVESQT